MNQNVEGPQCFCDSRIYILESDDFIIVFKIKELIEAIREKHLIFRLPVNGSSLGIGYLLKWLKKFKKKHVQHIIYFSSLGKTIYIQFCFRLPLFFPTKMRIKKRINTLSRINFKLQGRKDNFLIIFYSQSKSLL